MQRRVTSILRWISFGVVLLHWSRFVSTASFANEQTGNHLGAFNPPETEDFKATPNEREISFPVYIKANDTILELRLDTDKMPAKAILLSSDSSFIVRIDQLYSDIINDWLAVVVFVFPSFILVFIHGFIVRRLRALCQQTEYAHDTNKNSIRITSDARDSPTIAVWPVHCVWCSEKCTRGFYCGLCGSTLVFPDMAKSDVARQKAHFIQKRIHEKTGINASDHRLSSTYEDNRLSSSFNHIHSHNPSSLYTPGTSRSKRAEWYQSQDTQQGETDALLGDDSLPNSTAK